jgi:hypothetical protein
MALRTSQLGVSVADAGNDTIRNHASFIWSVADRSEATTSSPSTAR